MHAMLPTIYHSQRSTNMTANPRSWVRFAVCAVVLLCASRWLARTSAVAAQKSDSAQSAKELPAQVSGQVIRSDTLEPVPKAEVILYPQFETAEGSRTVRSGVDGSFVFPDLKA